MSLTDANMLRAGNVFQAASLLLSLVVIILIVVRKQHTDGLRSCAAAEDLAIWLPHRRRLKVMAQN